MNHSARVSVFDFRSYKRYLHAWIEQQPRGGRAALAGHAQIQPAYLSQVLNGNAHLSLEQAERLRPFLEHSRAEGAFFLLLVEFERAGTSSLKKYFEDQIEAAIETNMDLKKRLGVKSVLSVDDQARYYSSWHYAAVHILVTIPEYRKAPAIARHLNLSAEMTAQILSFLVSIGLVERKNSEYFATTARIHLGNDSPLFAKHHVNWRIQAIAATDRLSESNLHYSSVVTLSKKDAVRIKSRLVSEIEEIKTVIRESPAEELHCFNLDFFRV